MPGSSRLTDSDVRTLMRLMGELSDLPHDPLIRGEFLMNRLSELVHAQWGVLGLLEGFRPDGHTTMHDAVQGGSLDAGLASRFFEYTENQCAADPMVLAAAAAQPRCMVFTRAQVVDDQTWYNSPHYCDFRRHAHLDESIYAIYPFDKQGNAFGLGLTRPGGAKPFTERERKMVAFVSDGLAWFYHSYRQHAAAEPRLAPALRRTLNLLKQGASEKEVAKITRLSPHTVHDHVKALYRHFQVSSRGELLAKVFRIPPGGRVGQTET